MPALPRRIGIVTSIDGAALRDIIRVLRRRYPNAHLVIAPTRVQGEGAGGRNRPRVSARSAASQGVDVIIVARGGGSLEDLWAFNEEVVARAIAASPVPVISGVGHETDFTIADFVADLRAPTPSAAAELVVRRKDDFCALHRSARRTARRCDARARRRLESRINVLAARPGTPGFAGGSRCAAATRRTSQPNCGGAMAATLARHERRHLGLRAGARAIRSAASARDGPGTTGRA